MRTNKDRTDMGPIKDFATRVALRSHALWSWLVPGLYYPYRVSYGRIYLDIAESRHMLARALDRYEPAKTQALQALLPAGGVFLDVGGNKGDFSLLAARRVGASGAVHVFEPEPSNSRWIQRSIDINRFENVRLHQLALSDAAGTAQLHIGAKSGWHTLVAGQADREQDVVVVRTIPLDSLRDEMDCTRPVDVMKIDVEGAEMQVLRGARRTIDNSPRLSLLLDLHPQLGVSVDEVFTFLADLGFTMCAEQPPFDRPIQPDPDLRSAIARRF